MSAKIAIIYETSALDVIRQQSFCYFCNIFADFAGCAPRLLVRLSHPHRHILAHALLEGEAESTVATVAAVVSQLLDCEGAFAGDSLAVELDEMLDAQIVDIGIVCRALHGEVLAEIETIRANSFGQLKQRQIMLQVES